MQGQLRGQQNERAVKPTRLHLRCPVSHSATVFKEGRGLSTLSWSNDRK
jgi:hypothetical protein